MRGEDLNYPPIFGQSVKEENIGELKANIASLRMSRRILISLVESLQDEAKKEQKRLLEDNRRLKRHNVSYAQRLWEKNQKIRRLEQAAENLKHP